MNDSDIEELRQLLLRQQAELKALVDDSRDSSRPVELDQTTVGRVSRIDAIQGQQMAQETARRRGHQLEKDVNAPCQSTGRGLRCLSIAT